LASPDRCAWRAGAPLGAPCRTNTCGIPQGDGAEDLGVCHWTRSVGCTR